MTTLKYLLIDQLQHLLNNISKIYVKKVAGKDLSDNNFDNIYKTNVDNNTLNRHNHNNKTILDGILQNKIDQWNIAEQNVQSNWTETDSMLDSFIKNKPIKLSQFENDLNFIDDGIDRLKNYYDKQEVDSLVSKLKGSTIKNISIPVSSWNGLTYVINNSVITTSSTIMISIAFDSIPFAQKANIRFKQETGRIIAYANKLPISTIVIEEIKIIN